MSTVVMPSELGSVGMGQRARDLVEGGSHPTSLAHTAFARVRTGPRSNPTSPCSPPPRMGSGSRPNAQTNPPAPDLTNEASGPRYQLVGLSELLGWSTDSILNCFRNVAPVVVSRPNTHVRNKQPEECHRDRCCDKWQSGYPRNILLEACAPCSDRKAAQHD